MTDLWTLPAHALVEGYKQGTFTPLEALEDILDRCDAVNPGINAIIARNDAMSREMAIASSERWAAGHPLSELDGVPISVKDNLLVAGLPATWGSRGLADNYAGHDEVPVARLREGGAVLFAKTNVPELTLQGYTDNLLFGATGLPFAPQLTPGGSSGGAASAVAAGIGPLALCTDGGGSIRRPAAHAGLFGFKPGTGRVRRGAGFPAILGAFEVVGPIGRDAEDIATMFHRLSFRPRPVHQTAHYRILYARHFYAQPVDAEILHLCDLAAERLKTLGHEVDFIDSFDAVADIDAIWPVISASGVAWLKRTDKRIAAHLGKAISEMAEKGESYSAADYAEALVRLEDMRLQYDEAMAGYDFLMTPAIAAFSWSKEQSHPETIDSQTVGPRGHAVFTAFANALGLPAITLPLLGSDCCLPCGVQLVGNSGDDECLLRIARQWS